LLISKIDQRGKEVEEGQEDGQISAAKTEATEEIKEFGDLDEIVFSMKVQYYGSVAHTLAFLKRESYAQLDLRGEDHGEHVSKQL